MAAVGSPQTMGCPNLKALSHKKTKYSAPIPLALKFVFLSGNLEKHRDFLRLHHFQDILLTCSEKHIKYIKLFLGGIEDSYAVI